MLPGTPVPEQTSEYSSSQPRCFMCHCTCSSDSAWICMPLRSAASFYEHDEEQGSAANVKHR